MYTYFSMLSRGNCYPCYPCPCPLVCLRGFIDAKAFPREVCQSVRSTPPTFLTDLLRVCYVMYLFKHHLALGSKLGDTGIMQISEQFFSGIKMFIPDLKEIFPLYDNFWMGVWNLGSFIDVKKVQNR